MNHTLSLSNTETISVMFVVFSMFEDNERRRNCTSMRLCRVTHETAAKRKKLSHTTQMIKPQDSTTLLSDTDARYHLQHQTSCLISHKRHFVI